MIMDPCREARLVEVPARQREDGGHDVFLGGVDSKSIQPKEEIHSLQGWPLASIDEWMILCNAESV